MDTSLYFSSPRHNTQQLKLTVDFSQEQPEMAQICAWIRRVGPKAFLWTQWQKSSCFWQINVHASCLLMGKLSCIALLHFRTGESRLIRTSNTKQNPFELSMQNSIVGVEMLFPQDFELSKNTENTHSDYAGGTCTVCFQNKVAHFLGPENGNNLSF